jgi:hypothetical protein
MKGQMITARFFSFSSSSARTHRQSSFNIQDQLHRAQKEVFSCSFWWQKLPRLHRAISHSPDALAATAPPLFSARRRRAENGE